MCVMLADVAASAKDSTDVEQSSLYGHRPCHAILLSVQHPQVMRKTKNTKIETFVIIYGCPHSVAHYFAGDRYSGVPKVPCPRQE
jgi:hypothetical protein